ncbi:uncharacterized protein PRCAT00001059001 [Priceomyces carsonii]|uniref:uncharacterized protein n=1 Tax=Priceomyces carsonii TaxID=28549 RepID=UPI002EDAC0A0|nr:unnamed protein product [Priceomyces carsonii]
MSLPRLLHYHRFNGALGIARVLLHSTRCGWYSLRSLRLISSDSKVAPDIKIKWYFATDVPKSKPTWYNYSKEKDPLEFLPFSEYDSNRLEKCYKKFLDGQKSSRTIDVNEDKLFEVDFKTFELSPVYWEGPVYEVRRGVWFNSDGMPLGLQLSKEIEAGYQSNKSYLMKKRQKIKEKEEACGNDEETPENFNRAALKEELMDLNSDIDIEKEQDIHDLGDGKLVLYCNEKDAVIFPSSMSSNFQINVLRKFGSTPVSLLSVERIQRGYSEGFKEAISESLVKNPIPGIGETFKNEIINLINPSDEKKISQSNAKITGDDESEDPMSQGNNGKMQTVLESDFDLELSPSKSKRDIDHLVLCVHGIGQILGPKYESVNFTHSVNVLRKTMKEVFQEEELYRRLAYPKDVDSEESKYNNRIQVLPISWRHKIDFQPQNYFKSYDKDGHHRLPKLSEINVDGVKSLRNILGDVVLDVLLYYEPLYIKQIFKVVTDELNEVYHRYMERNPNFKGKVHIMGHSLGSAITFDILSSQATKDKSSEDEDKALDFDVTNLFCVGSPIGVFKLLEQKNIVLRDVVPEGTDPTDKSNNFNSPKCQNLYNIFHPCDPVSYRMEPLVHPRFSKFRPEPIPFAVKGINSQFNNLVDFGDAISERISRASSWFKTSEKPSPKDKSTASKAQDEDALGDIMSSLAKGDVEEQKAKKLKMAPLRDNDLRTMTSLNRTGRIDYSLPTGMFDISVVSAISAHVSYFEDKDTAGFIMKELLKSNDNAVKQKLVSFYE